ncbi:MAG: hypothetical protein LBJ23_00200 [Tannerella sp.]|jgi:hypothetical protein|nr:hypothetical protein [Tannerella sp.]
MAHDYKNILERYEAIADIISATIHPFKTQYEKLKTKYGNGGISEYDYRQQFCDLISKHESSVFNKSKVNELIDNIDKAEKEIKKSNKWLYRIAMLEIPAVLILIIIVYWIGHSKFDFLYFLYVSVGILTVFIVHTYFILRFYQQSIKTAKELLEKRLGACYLNIAITDPSLEKIITIGIYMFLGHHGKSIEPFGPDDSPFKQIADLKKNDGK